MQFEFLAHNKATIVQSSVPFCDLSFLLTAGRLMTKMPSASVSFTSFSHQTHIMSRCGATDDFIFCKFAQNRTSAYMWGRVRLALVEQYVGGWPVCEARDLLNCVVLAGGSQCVRQGICTKGGEPLCEARDLLSCVALAGGASV